MESILDKRRELDEWAVVERFLPSGWRRQARVLGALRRRRGVGGAGALLRCLLLHLAEGCSLAETALRAREAGLGRVSGVALFKRLRAAGPWLGWMAGQFWRERQPLAEPPELPHRLIAVDATVIAEQGVTGSQWRVHWAVDVGTLDCVEFGLTDLKGGETFRNFKVLPGHVMSGDRAYGRARGIHHVVAAGGHVLARFHPQHVPMYDLAGGDQIRWRKRLRGLRVGKILDLPVRVPYAGQWVHGRAVIVRRSRGATEKARRKVERKARRNQRRPSAYALALARYLMIFTTLPAESYPSAKVLGRYRLRWQIELVFKRLKSIMALGQLPKRDPASARAWISGKLLVAMLVERLRLEAESFSPWGYPLATPPKSLAGDVVPAS